jgi:2-polyprenyl-6-methoxyphenol hydroxylase-like FAD-dependent oxidoreductase
MTTSSVTEPRLRAAVLGGSIAGLMAGLVLHKNDFEVVLYERQKEYVRSIQWTVRQSFINYLSSVDEKIGKHVYEELVHPITNGYRYLSDRTLKYPNGAYKYRTRERPKLGDGAVPQVSCADSLDDDAVGIIRARELEEYLFKELKRKSNLDIHLDNAPKCVLFDDNQYALKNDGEAQPTHYDVIVVCVGAGWSRTHFKMIDYKPVSRERAQVSGEVDLKRRGMVINYQHAKIDKDNVKNLPSGELLFSALLSTDEKDTTCWVIGDVSSEFLVPYGNAKKENNKNIMADLAKEECGKIAARTMLETEQSVRDAAIKGVVDDTVKTFPSQAKISTAACAGDNLILAGDAVGAGHWAVGGGMHVAGMCHQRRLDALAAEWRTKKDKKDRQLALEEYSKGVLEDTKAWISRSMEYYYLSIPKDVVDAVFKDVLEAFDKDSNIDAPNEMRERIVSVYFGPKSERSDTPAKDAGVTGEV